ncbi:MAG: thioredoxin domain-containing protein, partial [Acidobacteriota bacterium]|nr:thioredoxin domain-containing protein [Acidobacteriota bacterium]
MDAIQQQQTLILNKLIELEAKLTASGTGAAVTPQSTTDLGGEAFMGATAAKVALIEYGDYECPYCREFERSAFPEILERYIKPGKVRFYYRDLPLPAHPHAILAARAAHCAADQSKYWEMHDALFQNQNAISNQKLVSIA